MRRRSDGKTCNRKRDIWRQQRDRYDRRQVRQRTRRLREERRGTERDREKRERKDTEPETRQQTMDTADESQGEGTSASFTGLRTRNVAVYATKHSVLFGTLL